MGVRSFETMVPMRDGARLNTFVFLPESGGPRFPVILHRTPYGIAASRVATSRSIRIAAAVTVRKARTGFMPMTRPTATTRSTG